MSERIAAWGIDVERIVETDRAALVFGRRDGQPVVVKVLSSIGDEWRAGEILRAFDGRGTVRVHDHVDGAVLLDRLDPGDPLSRLLDDEEATRILARTIRAMAPGTSAVAVPTTEDWGASFDRYLAGGDRQVPSDLVAAAQTTYAELCDTQGPVRLLHGDLHHDNVLFDRERGWLAVDPKGVIGEPAFEVGAAFRNPHDRPDLFTDGSVIRKRVECFANELGLDRSRILAWAFTQAVLSALWSVEDGFPVEPSDGRLELARVLRE